MEAFLKNETAVKFKTKEMQDMRHISHLSEVQLCGQPHPWQPFKQLRYPGGRKARAALDRAVGWVHLEDWKNPNVKDPVLYFRSALAVISKNATTHPGQPVVEQVLSSAFQGNFSGTLNNSSLTAVYKNLGRALKKILNDIDKAQAITPGFEDMVVIPDPQAVQVIQPAQQGALLLPGQGQRNALEETLGSAFIDYFNGYPVGDITEAFAGYGGTDLNIQNALLGAFGRDFSTSLRNADVGPNARNAMSTLAKNFGTALQNSNNAHPGTLLPEFSDLLLIH
ncbi:MAG: hypothetical protein WB586_20300 [Chthoniobacterales bacterium]